MTEHLDGNVLAGVTADLFGREMTLVTGVCGSCRASSHLAELEVYVAAGIVARCPFCGAVLMRIVETPARTWVDLSGIATLVF